MGWKKWKGCLVGEERGGGWVGSIFGGIKVLEKVERVLGGG